MKNMLSKFLQHRGGAWTLKEFTAKHLRWQDYRGIVPSAYRSPTEEQRYDLRDLARPESDVSPWQAGNIDIVLLQDVVFWPSNGGVKTRDGQLLESLFHCPAKFGRAVSERRFTKSKTTNSKTTAATLGHLDRNFLPSHGGLNSSNLRALASQCPSS